MDRDLLRDHAAHRRADDMGARDAERVHQPDRVGRHVLEQIRRGDPLALLAFGDRRAGVGWRLPVDLGRLADVAIVVAHDPQAAFGQRDAEVVFPQDHLRAEAGDQQQRRIAGRPKVWKQISSSPTLAIRSPASNAMSDIPLSHLLARDHNMGPPPIRQGRGIDDATGRDRTLA